MKTLEDLIAFLDHLYQNEVEFQLDKIRDSILIEIKIHGQIWEVEYMQDGTIEIEKYISDGDKFDEKEINTLFEVFSEKDDNEEWWLRD